MPEFPRLLLSTSAVSVCSLRQNELTWRTRWFLTLSHLGSGLRKPLRQGWTLSKDIWRWSEGPSVYHLQLKNCKLNDQPGEQHSWIVQKAFLYCSLLYFPCGKTFRLWSDGWCWKCKIWCDREQTGQFIWRHQQSPVWAITTQLNPLNWSKWV